MREHVHRCPVCRAVRPPCYPHSCALEPTADWGCPLCSSLTQAAQQAHETSDWTTLALVAQALDHRGRLTP